MYFNHNYDIKWEGSIFVFHIMSLYLVPFRCNRVARLSRFCHEGKDSICVRLYAAVHFCVRKRKCDG